MDYELLATHDDLLIKVLEARMEWTTEQARRFLGRPEKAGFGTKGAIEMLRLQDETEQASRKVEQAIAQQRSMVYG